MKKVYKWSLLFLLTFLVYLMAGAQDPIVLGKMTFDYRIEGDSLLIQLSAPTTGWLAVGFNHQNDIVGSDLKMFCIENGNPRWEDQYVKGAGDHPSDQSEGGTCEVELLDALETEGQSSFCFRIPLNSNDPLDFQHRPGQECWLILAFSRSDDFQHHSVMRKHHRLKLLID